MCSVMWCPIALQPLVIIIFFILFQCQFDTQVDSFHGSVCVVNVRWYGTFPGIVPYSLDC